MSECMEVTPDGMAEQNLLRHMAVAVLCARTDALDRDGAYRMWATLSEEFRETLRAEARPLLPFVTEACTRAEAAEARVEALETAGEQVAVALEVACKGLGEKSPRKTVPVLAAWDAAKGETK